MSHQLGAIKFKDGTIRYYEYNGTVDIPVGRHYATPEEVFERWRNHGVEPCECGRKEGVDLFTDYGGGFYFEGQACKSCGGIETDGYDFDIIERDETEDWAASLPAFCKQPEG